MLESRIHKHASNVIFATLLTGIYDINRNETLQSNDFSIIQKWYDSITKLQLNAIVFHNTFSKSIVDKYTNKHIQFIEIEYNKKLNPNVFRYFVYQNYIQQHFLEINHLFVTDITDVEVVSNPFESNMYLDNPGYLFCGDEPKLLNTDWMRNHNSHLRNSMPEFSLYETLNQHSVLLNCGVIGGNISVMKLLFDKMTAMHETYSYTNTTAYTLDMGVFNFIARTSFEHNIIHGKPVNTVFKAYENDRTDCWFRHK